VITFCDEVAAGAVQERLKLIEKEIESIRDDHIDAIVSARCSKHNGKSEYSALHTKSGLAHHGLQRIGNLLIS
jgi:hypothetical protein